MFKFFVGVLTGALLLLGGLYGAVAYIQSPEAQLNRCITLYTDNSEELQQEESVKEAILEGGFANFEALVTDRCKRFIKGGQKF